MKTMSLSQVKAGDQIGSDVQAGGMLLVQKGTRLTDTLIASLNRRGVTEVVLAEAGLDDPDADTAREELREQTVVIQRHAQEENNVRATETFNKALARLDAQFVRWQDDLVMQPLKNAGVRFWGEQAKRLSERPAGKETRAFYAGKP